MLKLVTIWKTKRNNFSERSKNTPNWEFCTVNVVTCDFDVKCELKATKMKLDYWKKLKDQVETSMKSFEIMIDILKAETNSLTNDTMGDVGISANVSDGKNKTVRDNKIIHTVTARKEVNKKTVDMES